MTRPRIIVFMVSLALCWSCGGGATDVPEDTAGREAFIGAYLDLRTAALNSETTEFGDEARDSILAAYGVTGQDLLDFIDTHGEDVEFMHDLWAELEVRLIERIEQNTPDEENEGADGVEEIEGGDRDAGVSP